MGYNYRCSRCNSNDIVFKEISGDKIIFHCRFCEEDFVAKDQESGFLPQKIESLRKRFPPLGKKRDSKKKRVAHRRNFKQLHY